MVSERFVLTYDGAACTVRGYTVGQITFSYHMWGWTNDTCADSIGELRLVNAMGVTIWSVQGSQGPNWRTATAAVFSDGFAFEYVRDSPCLSTIAPHRSFSCHDSARR